MPTSVNSICLVLLGNHALIHPYLCVDDHPDLYFWVEHCIGDVWATVQRPLIRCNADWETA